MVVLVDFEDLVEEAGVREFELACAQVYELEAHEIGVDVVGEDHVFADCQVFAEDVGLLWAQCV